MCPNLFTELSISRLLLEFLLNPVEVVNKMVIYLNILKASKLYNKIYVK
jgi:hypothetical protein